MKNLRNMIVGCMLLVSTSYLAAQSSLPGKEFYDNLPFTMAPVEQPVFPDRSVFITDFGAVADGETLCTKAINRAIESIHQQGGGKVIIPAGLWITGPIELLSHVNLHAERNALVLFTADHTRYPIITTNFEGTTGRRSQSPIWAKGQTNIAITGEGIFDGNGDTWRPVKKMKMTAHQWNRLINSGGGVDGAVEIWYPSAGALKGSIIQRSDLHTDADWEEIRDFLRPVLLNFTECSKILLQGVTFKNSPNWCLHPLMCSDITIDGVLVSNPWYAQNGDALDLESCNQVLVINSLFDAGDDGICLKSGKNEEGRRRGIPTRNVVVYNNTVLHGHGGFVVGSEMSGGVENIYVDNCIFTGTDVGLRFKSGRGRGGKVKNIYISNIYMRNIAGDPIIFDLYYGMPRGEEVKMIPVTEETPVFRDIYIKDVICHGSGRALFFNGLPETPVRDVEMENVTILEASEGAAFNYVRDVKMKNIRLGLKSGEPAGITFTHTENIELDGKIIGNAGENAKQIKP